MLCTFCQRIELAHLVAFEVDFDEEPAAGQYQLLNAEKAYQHQPNFKALCVSGKNQCDLCLLISEVLEGDQNWNDDDKIYGSVNGESESDLVLKLRTDCSNQIYIYCVDGTERQEDAGDRVGSLKGYAHRRLITVDALSDSATTIFRRWFAECQNTHIECSTDVDHAMPKRVIDVGHFGDHRDPRVYESEAETGHWAALSHCWGKTVTIKLTLATYKERIQGISMAALPKNFRDAIAVTRMLGIQYLWIDSLCIIQDSTEDWLQESAKMGEIYKNSLITIAATNAKESTAGFLGKRQAEVRCDLQYEYMRFPVYIRPRIEWYGFMDIVGPLNHRAWVLQERLLAPRILHFGGQQIMWQCQTKTLAEGFCDTDSALEAQIPGTVEKMLKSKFDFDNEHSFDKESEFSTQAESRGPILHNAPRRFNQLQDNIYGQWYHLIEMYSRLKLTNGTDKLPAIAGIAQQVHLRTGDTYLVGLWKSHIQQGLQWLCTSPGSMVKPPVPRAPSWSWAALDVAGDDFIMFSLRHRPYEHDVQLVGFSSNLVANGCLGTAFGTINLLGLWSDTTLAPPPATVPAGPFIKSSPIPLTLKGQSGIHAAGRLDCDANSISLTAMGILQIGKIQYTGPRQPAEEFISALLLQRTQHTTAEDVPEKYIRIGIATLLNTCDPVIGWEERVIEVV
ncbi:hypothetical protein MMC07_004291 [Pseudocyphellaria aurata]|nr:hypothetical protein [Pseudocyphellaria aurata]